MVGSSMETTLEAGDTILINKMAYFRSGPDRFDVIVFEISGKEHSFYNVSRVIGLPGERVSISEGHVYINGELLDEPINVEDVFIEGLADGDGITLDDDEYFVLGDNRNDSEDSRFTNIGNIVKEQIIGKAWLRLNKFGFINSMNMKEEQEEQDEGEAEEKE